MGIRSERTDCEGTSPTGSCEVTSRPLPGRLDGRQADSSGRRNDLELEIAMTTQNRGSDRSGEISCAHPGDRMWLIDTNRVLFWRLIAKGLSSKDAAVQVGASAPVGSRWFREAGGMMPSQFSKSAPPLSRRYLRVSEREEIALHRAQGPGVYAIARKIGRAASAILRELRWNAATRGGGFEYRATTAPNLIGGMRIVLHNAPK